MKPMRHRGEPSQKLPRTEQPRVNWKALDDFVTANKPPQEEAKARQSKVTGTSTV